MACHHDLCRRSAHGLLGYARTARLGLTLVTTTHCHSSQASILDGSKDRRKWPIGRLAENDMNLRRVLDDIA
jgi:hypothetical protein